MEYDPQIASVLQSALGGRPSYDVSPDAISQYFNQAVTNPMMRTWSNEIAPKINETYARAGALFSTRRNDTVRQSLGDISSQLSSGLGNWQFQGMSLAAQLAESARARQLAGVELANQQVMQPVFRSQALTGAQSGLTALQSARNEAAYNEWLRTRPEASPWLKLGMAYLGTPMQENVFGPSPFAQVSDLVGGLGGAAASYYGQKSMASALAGLAGNKDAGTASTVANTGSGIASGAAMGTAVMPGVGTIIGGLLGGLGSLFTSK